jgi:AraC-like DNA-binding protein
MDSFFFNITDRRYKITTLFKDKMSDVQRVDISNGIVFLEGKVSGKKEEIHLKNLDRMLMLVMVKEGSLHIIDNLSQKEEVIKQGEIAMYASSKQDMVVTMQESINTEVFILFIADFFLKRYLSMDKEESIDYLYFELQKEISLKYIDSQPIDALSLYIVYKILNIPMDDRMQSIRAEHLVTEFMIHRFSLLDILSDSVSPESIELAKKAKMILLQDFINPPTIETLAHLCATNETKIKKIFKQVYHTTLHAYVQKLRLDEANLLLREENLTIGEIAKRVGYKHQGHFSKLFFLTYGVYPKDLMKR